MNGTAHFVAAKRRNNALNLPPMTKANDIPHIAAPLGTGSSLEPGIVAIAFDQIGRIGQRKTAMNEGTMHHGILNPSSVDRLRTSIVNAAFTMLGLAYARPLGMCANMTRSTRAGGCFLTICILAGFPLGLTIGNPMKGILIGTATGIALALLTWLVDRRRRD